MIRLFAALELPAEIAEGLIRRQHGLPGADWRPREALHITLRFFGEVQNTVAADLDHVLSEIALPAFDLHLEGAGAFGDEDHMRAVWAGAARSEPLHRLARKCESAARKAGLKSEARAYRPHVTLAYLRRASAPNTGEWVVQNSLMESPAWRVNHFHLYSSWLSQDGSRYDIERTYQLSETP
jgi:2'-5' RNA ligase